MLLSRPGGGSGGRKANFGDRSAIGCSQGPSATVLVIETCVATRKGAEVGWVSEGGVMSGWGDGMVDMKEERVDGCRWKRVRERCRRRCLVRTWRLWIDGVVIRPFWPTRKQTSETDYLAPSVVALVEAGPYGIASEEDTYRQSQKVGCPRRPFRSCGS